MGELSRRAASGSATLPSDLAAAGLVLVVVDHASAAVLPALKRAGDTKPGGPPAPVVVVGCPDALSAAKALRAGADLAVRDGAEDEETAAALATALKMRELAELSLKDDLTSAWNRRYFEVALPQHVEHARRTGVPLSIIFLDIDNLKAVNARHGHAMGSHVLRELAIRLIRTVRAGDAVMRYGGDEFCVVLPGLDVTAALEVAERIRDAVASEAFHVGAAGEVRLTASFGIASCPEHATDAEGLVAAADSAMIAIKERQRNGIRIAGAA